MGNLRDQKAVWGKYLTALAIFLASRFLVFLAIVFSHAFIPKEANHQNAWDAGSTWYRYLLRYDAGWYFGLVEGGYAYNGDDSVPQSPAFYPLYPLVSKTVSLSGIPKALSLLVVSNTAIMVAVVLAFKLIRNEHGDKVAILALALISFFPTSIFFSAGYTESLALLLIITFFLLLAKQQYYLASCLAGLASGTRSTGLVLIVPLLLELWRRFSQNRKRLALRAAICTVLATSGLWLFIVYLWITFGTPLAFMSNLHAWETGGPSNNLLNAVTLRPFYEHLGDIGATGPYPNSLDPWFFLAFAALLIVFRKKVSLSFWSYALGVLLLPYLTRSGGVFGFQSFMRYLLLAFPVFIIMGRLFEERLWLGLSVTAICAGFLFMYSAMFAQWY